MNTRALSVIMTIVLTAAMNINVFAAPSTGTSDALKQTQDSKKDIEAKVQELDKQINEVIKKVDSNKKDMNKIAQDIKDTQLKLETAEKNSKVQEDLFGKRVRAMYVSGTDSYVQVILASSSLNDFVSRLDMVTKIIGFDNQVIRKLKEERQAISKQKETLNYKNSKLAALKTSNENTLLKLNKDIKQQKALLSKASEREKQLIAMEAANTSSYNQNLKGASLSRGMSISGSYSQVLNMEATAYSDNGITASGAATKRDANGYSTIAVDPRVIPLGSTVYVEDYGYAIAADIGGAIQGNIIDVFFPSNPEALSWGRRPVKVYILK